MSREIFKQYERFLEGNGDICTVILERERLGDKGDMYYLKDCYGRVIYKTFRHRGESFERTDNHKGNQTGGKRPYTMLFLDGIRELRGVIPPDYLGCLVLLSGKMEMGTGKLVTGRDNKPMTLRNIAEYLYVSERTAGTIMRTFIHYGIAYYSRGRGYYISRSYMARGVKRDNEKGKADREDSDSKGTEHTES